MPEWLIILCMLWAGFAGWVLGRYGWRAFALFGVAVWLGGCAESQRFGPPDWSPDAYVKVKPERPTCNYYDPAMWAWCKQGLPRATRHRKRPPTTDANGNPAVRR